MTGYTCCDYHPDDSLVLCRVYYAHRGPCYVVHRCQCYQEDGTRPSVSFSLKRSDLLLALCLRCICTVPPRPDLSCVYSFFPAGLFPSSFRLNLVIAVPGPPVRLLPPPLPSAPSVFWLLVLWWHLSALCGHWLALRTGDIMLWPLAPSHGILHEISPGASWLAVGAVASSSLHYFSAAACLHTELHLLKRNCKNMRKSRIVGLCICWWIQESAGGHFPKQSSKIAFYNARDRKWQTDIEKWNCIESKCSL